MDEVTRAVTWEAPEHHHLEKGSDWFWVLGIVATAIAVAAFLLGNYLFALLIVIAGGLIGIIANREPEVIIFFVGTRGIRIGNELYPYNTLNAYDLNEDPERGAQLLLRSRRLFMPLLIVPIPEEYVDDIEDLIAPRLPHVELEEPFVHKFLEIIGF